MKHPLDFCGNDVDNVNDEDNYNVSYDDLDKLVLIMNTTFYSLHNNLSSFWFSFSITVSLFAFCWIFTENIF